MRVGLISFNGQARNAIGNHLAEKLGFFLDRGADVRVFLQEGERLHPALARHVEILTEVQTSGPAWDFLTGADLVVVDFSQAYDLLHYLPLLADGKPRLLVEYHGITPPQFWPSPQRAALEQGLAQRGLVWCADYALVHSRFTRRELVSATDFPKNRTFQLDFPLDERFCPGPPRWSLRSHLGLEAARVLLYVGRLAVNKCVPLLIEAVHRLRDLDPAVHAVVLGDNTDVYGEEERRCREIAQSLGVAQRVHFLGSRNDDRLVDAYRDADVFVMPSLHEGFCIPLIEAMACGLPVVAARATALPETAGEAGITFKAGAASDLALQLRRVLLPRWGEGAKRETRALDTARRIALVSFRFGADIVGGAETSLRKIALALTRHDYKVEIFTTCTRAEGDWTNELPAGTSRQDGLLIHRFPIDAHNREQHLASVRRIVEADGLVVPADEQAYLDNSIHSRQLLATLRERIDAFDAVIAGPYLFGLTCAVARAFPAKTLLLGCFHHEPLAHLQAWPANYAQIGGILYHSPEERDLVQNELGINHPNGVEIGTYLEPGQGENFSSPNAVLSQRYVVYCGRYSRQKDVPRLLEFAARYNAQRPGRFVFAFMGQGEVCIPKAPWARDLGRVDEPTKRAVLAGAAALVQLSRQESLSLVALEAWAVCTPVVVDGHCPVLAGQVRRSGGGQAIGDYAEFAEALDSLWDNPAKWRERGRLGHAYVHERYASESAFAAQIQAAIARLQVPLVKQMRSRGLERAALSTRSHWRERFGQMVEQILDQGPKVYRFRAAVSPLQSPTLAKVGTRTILVPVRVHNSGTHAVCAAGPARHVLFCAVGDEPSRKTELSGLFLPGKTQILAAIVSVPAQEGEYPMRLWIDRDKGTSPPIDAATSVMIVGASRGAGCTAPFLEVAQDALVEVERRRCLPDDYLDVTLGRFARWKRWIKNKLLGNFKRGYVDVLSRQQSQVNRQILVALQQLTECSATLDHALRGLQQRMDRLEERLDAEQKTQALVERLDEPVVR